MERIVTFIDARLPPSLLQRDEDVRRRARLVLLFSWALTCLAPVFVTNDVRHGRWQNALIILSAVPFGLMASIVFRKVKSLTFMGHYVAAVFGGVLAARTLMTGGITAFAPFWMASLPVFALLLANRRAAFVWLGLDLAFFVSILVGTKLGVQWADAWTPEERQKEFVIASSMLAVLMLTLTSLFEAAKERMRRELAKKQDDIRRMLDIMGQGFLSVGLDGRIAGPHSSVLERWFGAPTSGASFSEFLKPHDARSADWVRLAFESLSEDVLPFELVLEQFPARLTVGRQRFALEMKPVFHREKLQALVAVVTDVTAQVEQETAAREQREVLQVMDKALSDRRGFLGFFSEAERLVAAVVEAGSLRDVHTVKGNAALFGALTVAAVAHDVESVTIDQGEIVVSPAGRESLQAAWTAFATRVKPLVATRSETVEVPFGEVQALRIGLEQGKSHEALHRQVDGWLLEPVAQPLERLAGQARALAVRLGRLDPLTLVDDGGLRVAPETWAPVWSVMAHLVRNAVDHGLDGVDERTALSKPARPTIRFSARSGRDGVVEVSVSDDGRGIDWDQVREKAKTFGLACETRAELEAAVLSEGFSTAREVTDVSGRGVGLSAVAALCRELGGSLSISSERGRGATFTLRVSMAHPELRALAA